MIQVVGELSSELENLFKGIFKQHGLEVFFPTIERLSEGKVISVNKSITLKLQERGKPFYNWDLLDFSKSKSEGFSQLIDHIEARVKILSSILSLKSGPVADEFHGSIRVNDLAKSAKFYTWLFGVEPKEWTHRYVVFINKKTNLNFVLVVADNNELDHGILYHLGMGVHLKEDVVEFYSSALANGFHVEKLPRTTWRGTPLHELWLKDPDGTLIEVYARLTREQLDQMPANKEPLFLV